MEESKIQIKEFDTIIIVGNEKKEMKNTLLNLYTKTIKFANEIYMDMFEDDNIIKESELIGIMKQNRSCKKDINIDYFNFVANESIIHTYIKKEKIESFLTEQLHQLQNSSIYKEYISILIEVIQYLKDNNKIIYIQGLIRIIENINKMKGNKVLFLCSDPNFLYLIANYNFSEQKTIRSVLIK